MSDRRNGDQPPRRERAAPVGYTPPGHAPPPARPRLRPDLELTDAGAIQRGTHPGDRYVRLVARHDVRARLRRDEALTARELEPPKTSAGRAWRVVKRALIGRPLASSQAIHERLTRVKALAVLSSDALSSVAYGPEAALAVLVLAGPAATRLDLPIIVAIAALLAIVTVSYRQTIFAYPSGGGSYIVASDNLGELPGLTAAAALLIDYVLTVAVSVSAGVLALTSALPALSPYLVPLGLLCILLIMLGNLRGIRESGTIFAAPTYLFIGSILLVVAVGLVRAFVLRDTAATGVRPAFDPRAYGPPEALGAFLLLKAFASGCSAMTGVEAISNGVPALKPPESRNGATTMLWMSGILGAMLLGVTALSHQYGLLPYPSGNPTVLSQLTEQIVGRGWFHPFYYVVQAATLLVLVLAANTSYADFPRLASILARDRFVPRQFAFRGDHLAFTVGIVALSVCAAILLAAFKGDTSALIPLYAVGVFVSFTMSQSGMVARWWRQRGPGWRAKAAVNGVGAVATALVALIAGATKLISGEPLFRAFGHNVHAGSWIVIVLIPLLIALFLAIHRHYARAAQELAAETPVDPDAIRHTVIVPIAALNRVALQTLAYARSIAPAVTAVHVDEDPAAIAALREAWRRRAERAPFLRDVRLVTIESPYRELTGPLLAYIDELDRRDPADTLTVVLPEFVPAHWWEQLLHNQTALRLKAALLFRPGTVVTSVPYHLERGQARGTAGVAPRAGAER
ncbi:MAG TPA: APC family permease [Thermomicrobiales bacterium]|nr:APC family permease [Thermomicrobiales bacterium]